MEAFNLLFFSGCLVVLAVLSFIDFKTYLLPNKWVATLAACAFLFHFINGFETLSLHQMVHGGLVGFWTLYLIRAIGNWYYKMDSLGLGDVKLLGAGGLLLGVENVFFAITCGAFAGLIHGILFAFYISIKNKEPFSIKRLRIPAGPGFAIGIGGVALYQYWDLLGESFQSLL
ncbi:MAG: prepilin peptidase [Pseudomonadota bacterium]